MPQQERAQRTRRRILEAAAGVFAERGYASASMTEILSTAGVTKGALYFHFPSKKALAKAVVEGQFRYFADAGDPPEDGDASPWEPTGDADCIQTVIDLAHAFARRLTEDPVTRGAVRLAVEYRSFADPDATPYRRWIADLARLLGEARRRGELRNEIDIDVTAEVLVGAFTGVQLVAQALSGRTDLGASITGLWRFTLPGLATESHLEGLRPEGRQTRPLPGARPRAIRKTPSGPIKPQ